MKYLKDKNSRRRGVAIELAIGMLLIMVAMSTIIVTTTMIQIEKQKNSVNNLDNLITDIERMEYDQIGLYFEKIVYEEGCNLNKFDESEDNNIELRKTLYNLCYLYLTNNDQIDQDTLNNEITTFKEEIEKSLLDQLNTKFKDLKEKRNLAFGIEIDYSKPYHDIDEDEDGNPDSDTDVTIEEVVEEDIIKVTKTINFTYDLTITLKITDNDTSLTALTVKSNIGLQRTASLTTKYKNKFNKIPIEEDVVYTPTENKTEITMYEGYYLSFVGNENVKILEIIDKAESDENLSFFTINQPKYKDQNIDNSDPEQQTDEEFVEGVGMIHAKENSVGKTITIIIKYKKLIVEPKVPENEQPGTENPVTPADEAVEEETQEPQYEEKQLEITITVLSVPIDSDEGEGSGLDNSTGDSTEGTVTQPDKKTQNDIIIKRLKGYNIEYLDEKGDYLGAVYSYTIEDYFVHDRVHWEYN